MKMPSTRALLSTACASALILSSGIALAQRPPVRLAWTPSADVPQIAVALERGLWNAAGLDVSVVTFQSGRESLEALVGGQVDIAVIAEFPAATAALRGQSIAVVGDLSRYRANRIVTTAANPTLASLAGQKIGVTVGTNAQFQAETAMAAAGIQATIVNASPSDLLQTLVRKDIDAAALFPAFVPRAKQLLAAQYREIPTPAYVTHFVVIGSTAFLKDHAKDVSTLLKGAIDADAIIEKEPQFAQQAVVKATNGALPLAAVAAGWPDYEFRVVLRDDLLSLLAAEAGWITAKGLVKASGPVADVVRGAVNPEFLRSIAPDRVSIK